METSVSNDFFDLQNRIIKIIKRIGSALDSWEIKIQIFSLLGYRFINELYLDYINSTYEIDFISVKQYEDLPNEHPWLEEHKQQIIEDIGYFIYPSDLFKNITSRANSENLKEEVLKAFERINESCVDTLKDIFIFESNNYHNWDKSLKIIFEEIKDFEITERIDLLGSIYEIFISSYFNTGGNKGGEYYTPNDLARVMAKIALKHHEDEVKSIYDPTCGSGGLILATLQEGFFKLNDDIKIYGQEINRVSSRICKLNMLLNGINYKNINIVTNDTLLNDGFKGKEFDIVISNPPFSLSWEGKDNKDLKEDPRFKDLEALPPKKFADYAFILTALKHLKKNGTAVILCFPGTLYRSKAEAKIRKWLIENNFIEAIISLPTNLFYNTTIQTNLLILKKDRNDCNHQNILFADASLEFKKTRIKNQLTETNINNILHIYSGDCPKQINSVNRKQILETQECNLSVDYWLPKKNEN